MLPYKLKQSESQNSRLGPVHTNREEFESKTINTGQELGQENHFFIVISPFSKSSAFNVFSVHTKTQRRRFQIPPA